MNAYRMAASARSRRLRTVSAVLLLVVVVMAIYGVARLMPALISNVHRNAHNAMGNSAAALHMHHVLVVQTLAAAFYWLICVIMLVFMLLFAWLDIRETRSKFADERKQLFGQTSRGILKDIEKQEREH